MKNKNLCLVLCWFIYLSNSSHRYTLSYRIVTEWFAMINITPAKLQNESEVYIFPVGCLPPMYVSLFFILIHLLLGHLLQGSINGFLRNCRASLNQQNRKYHSAGCWTILTNINSRSGWKLWACNLRPQMNQLELRCQKRLVFAKLAVKLEGGLH